MLAISKHFYENVPWFPSARTKDIEKTWNDNFEQMENMTICVQTCSNSLHSSRWIVYFVCWFFQVFPVFFLGFPKYLDRFSWEIPQENLRNYVETLRKTEEKPEKKKNNKKLDYSPTRVYMLFLFSMCFGCSVDLLLRFILNVFVASAFVIVAFFVFAWFLSARPGVLRGSWCTTPPRRF